MDSPELERCTLVHNYTKFLRPIVHHLPIRVKGVSPRCASVRCRAIGLEAYQADFGLLSGQQWAVFGEYGGFRGRPRQPLFQTLTRAMGG